MKTCFSNATVAWSEVEITRRECLIREIPAQLLDAWRTLNPAVQMERCETPILTPGDYLRGHVEAGFELVAYEFGNGTRGYLRPETTVGTFEAFAQRFPEETTRRKRMPYCMWQVGCSFRSEKNTETMRASKLRLRQFYQMEFQLFASVGSKAPYLETALDRLVSLYGGCYCAPDGDLPHYSEKTLDWHIDDLEVAGCSIRRDWPGGMVFEIAIGLDRLVALQLAPKEEV